MDWRNLTKLGSVDTPLTPKMIQNGDVKKGDYVAAVGDLPLKDTGDILFKGLKYYEVLDVEPDGLIIQSEKVPWKIHFNKSDGGAQWFFLVVLTDDEKLGIFEAIPQDILQLLSEHKTISRNGIINECQVKYYSKDEQTQANTRDAVLQSLILLQRLGYIELGKAVGYYEITDKGRLFLRGKDFTEEDPNSKNNSDRNASLKLGWKKDIEYEEE